MSASAGATQASDRTPNAGKLRLTTLERVCLTRQEKAMNSYDRMEEEVTASWSETITIGAVALAGYALICVLLLLMV